MDRLMIQVSHASYEMKDEEMPDCTVCLIKFCPEEQIIVFPCDVKHYFHLECGKGWLEVKPECPLCRHDFTHQINKLEEEKRNDQLSQSVANRTELEDVIAELRQSEAHLYGHLNE